MTPQPLVTRVLRGGGLLLLAGLLAASVHAQSAADPAAVPASAAATGAPAGFIAPALPGAEDSQAARSKSQPGNNAPFWRAVKESGNQAGYSSLPGARRRAC